MKTACAAILEKMPEQDQLAIAGRIEELAKLVPASPFNPEATNAAARRAVTDHIADLRSQREDFLRQLGAQGAKIDDFGEKIGGARKDTAEKTGPRGEREEEDDTPAWRKRFVPVQVLKGEGEGMWGIQDARTEKLIRDGFRPKLFATIEEAEASLPLIAVAQKHRVVTSATKDSGQKYEIWREVTDRKRVRVVEQQFDTREDAMRFMAQNAEKILATKTSFGEEILVKPEQVAREGPPRRTRSATAEMFAETFGFRGVEFGNWNNQLERQEVMNHAFDGLLDLAEVLGIPPKAISLNGDLALAFGARGSGATGARAHYERDYGVINLTKMSGAGALAHEWMHALDHYFGRQDIPSRSEKSPNARGDMVYPASAGRDEYASHGFAYANGQIRPEVRDAVKAVVQALYKKAEKYVEDTKRAEQYLGRRRESLQQQINSIRDYLSREISYKKRANKPATTDQLAAFDALADKLTEGGDLEVRWISTAPAGTPANSRGGMAGRFSNDTLEAMSAILKEVRGTTGFMADKSGLLDGVRAALHNYREAVNTTKAAVEGTQRERVIPTDYVLGAKDLDKGRASDYWSTEHEMVARAFSAYVEDKLAARGASSDFLSFGSNNLMPYYVLLKVRPFPEGAEREAINEAFDRLFATLKVRETERGMALFARGGRAQPAEQATYQRDLFGNDLPMDTGDGAPLFDGQEEPAPAPAAKDILPPPTFAQVTRAVSTSMVPIGVTRVRSPADAAHVFAALRKDYRERFHVLVLDGGDHPIAYMPLFAGERAQTSVYPAIIATEVYLTEGAKKVWVAHNHPSGLPEPSFADINLTGNLAGLFGRDLGVEFAGHVIIAGTKFAYLDKDGNKVRDAGGDIPAKARVHGVPIVERQVVRSAANTPPDKISSPSLAKRLVPEWLGGHTGAVYLGAQNQFLAAVPMTAADMENLRSSGKFIGTIAPAAKSGAVGVIFHLDQSRNSSTDDAGKIVANRRAAKNLGAALQKTLDVQVLDIVESGPAGKTSLAERGESLAADGNIFYSSPGRSAVVETLEAVKDLPQSTRYGTSSAKAWPEVIRDMAEGRGYRAAPQGLEEVGYYADGNTLRLYRQNDEDTGGGANFLLGNEAYLQVNLANTDRPYASIGGTRDTEGSLAYQIAMTWAHNNGKRLVPDPSGITSVNRLRRSEAMIASMLRHRTSRHLEPHFSQYAGMLSEEDFESARFRMIDPATAIGKKLERLKEALWRDESLATSPEQAARIYESNLHNLALASSVLAHRVYPDAYLLELTREGGLRDALDQEPADLEVGSQVALGTGIGRSTLARAVAVRTALQGRDAYDVAKLRLDGDGRLQPGNADVLAGRGEGGALSRDAARRLVDEQGPLFYARGPVSLTDIAEGVAEAPPLAGLSVSEVYRQLYEGLGDRAVNALVDDGVLRVVASIGDLPADIRRAIYSSGNLNVDAVYDGRRTAYIVASNINPDRVVPVVFHELGEHYGLEAMIGEEEYAALLDKVRALHKNGDKAVGAAWAHVLDRYRDGSGNLEHPEGSDIFVREVIARVGEDARAMSQSWWRELLAKVRDFLRRIGVNVQLTADDLVVLVRASLARAVNDSMRAVPSGPGAPRSIAFHRGWHGSPHDFERFMLAHIGSGEGAQMFGWGLYFAGNREVAEYYRRKLARTVDFKIDGVSIYTLHANATREEFDNALPSARDAARWGYGRIIDALRYTKIPAAKPIDQVRSAALEVAEQARRNYSEIGANDRGYIEREKGIEALARGIVRDVDAGRVTANKGRLYEVELKPKEGEYLDWHKPLYKQSAEVRERLAAAGIDTEEPARTPPQIYDRARRFFHSFQAQKDAYDDIGIREAYREGWLAHKEGVDSFMQWYNGPTGGWMRGIVTRGRQSAKSGESFYEDLVYAMREAIDVSQNREIVDTQDGKQRASMYLKSIGIPGIRYLDGNSRASGDGHHNYVIFDEADVQVVSKFSRGGPAAAPAWYSELEQTVAGAKQDVAPAGQWKAWLANQRGVKADEIEWSGVREWLDLQKGKVKKQEILDYLRQNGVRIEERVLGGPTNTSRVDQLKVELDAAGYSLDTSADGYLVGVTRRSDGAQYEWNGNEWMPVIIAGDRLPADVAAKLKEITEADEVLSGDGGARYGRYTFPGGTNYREVLLKLPTKNGRISQFSIDEINKQLERGGLDPLDQEQIRVLNNGLTSEALGMLDDLEDRVGIDASEARADLTGGEEARTGVFLSTHWDDVNVIAHFRADDRVDTAGRRILMVHEWQSDYAQRGRREGFASRKVPFTRENLVARLTARYGSEEVAGNVADILIENAGDRMAQRDLMVVDGGFTEAEARVFLDAFEGQAFTVGVPPAPFVTKTEAWVALLVKRAIRMAVDGGYDGIAWTTGEQQVARYDLSKQIDRIDYSMDDDGRWKFSAIKGGREVLSRDGLERKDLEELLGKEITEKIIMGEGKRHRNIYDEEYRSLSGIDLKIGGEGMRDFYDKIVPGVVRDVLKKVGGGNLGRVKIIIPDRNAAQSDVEDRPFFAGPVTSPDGVETGMFTVFGDGAEVPQQYAREFDSFEDAADAAEDANEATIVESGGVMNQPGFYLTPAMREKAAGGMPMFSRGGDRKAVIEEARAIGLPLTGKTADIAELVAIAKKPPPTWTREELEKIAPHIAIHQDIRDGAEARVESIRREGLRGGMTDNLGNMLTGRAWTWGRNLQDGHAYLFFQRALKYEKPSYSDGRGWSGKIDSPWLTENMPFFDFPTKNGQDIYEAITQAPSQGPMFSRGQTKIPAFRRWFGKSKVVDANGEPLVVYRGLPEEPQPAEGVEWWTVSRDAAHEYIGDPELGDQSNITPAYLSIVNPFVLKTERQHAKLDKIMGYEKGALYDGQESLFENINEIAERLAELGYDGIVLDDLHEDRVAETFITFRPEQVKSAIGNVGTFDPMNPDILLSRPGSSGDPVLDSARRKAGLVRDERSPGERLADYFGEGSMGDDVRRWREAMVQGTVDRFHALKRIEQTIGNVPAEQSGYVAARLSTGVHSVMRAVLMYGAPVWKDGIIAKKDGTKGLLEIFEPVREDFDDWIGWMVGARASRLLEEGRENNLNAEEVKRLLALGEGNEERYIGVARQFAAFKRAILDLGEEAGLINPETRPVWDQADWIPFYRVADEGGAIGPRGRRGLANQTSGVRQLKGGQEQLNDPLENIIRNFQHLIDASMKNMALRRTVALLNEHGGEADLLRDGELPQVLERVGLDMGRELIPMDQVRRTLLEAGVAEDILDTMPSSVFKGLAAMWAVKPPRDSDVIRVMDKGKATYYRVNDPLLLRALTAIDAPDLSWTAPMRAFKRVLTRAVTSTPDFMLRNFFRDALQAWTINEDHFVVGIDSLRGAVKSLREEGGMVDMMFAGGSFMGGYTTGNDPAATAEAIRKALRKKGWSESSIGSFMGTVKNGALGLWEAWEEVGGAIENANREAVYEAARRNQKGAALSIFEAKDLMDYSMRGDWAVIQILGDVVPFFNARLQGLYKLGRAAAENPTRIAVRGGIIMLATLALLAANDGDDRYEELEEWDKDTFWHFWIGGQHFRVPKPFEIGVIFATVPERIARGIAGRDEGKLVMKRLWWNLATSLNLVEWPQIIAPAVEVWANRDTFTGRPIEGMGDQGKLPEGRYSANTSATMKELAALFPDVANATGMSPKRLEHLWRGYLGELGAYALGLSDIAVRTLTGAPERPSPRLDDLPVVKSFVREDPARSTRWKTELYDMHREVDEIYRSVNAYRKDGQIDRAKALIEENRGKLSTRGTLSAATDRLADIHRARDKVTLSTTLSPEEKRERLDKLQEQENQLSQLAATATRERFLQ